MRKTAAAGGDTVSAYQHQESVQPDVSCHDYGSRGIGADAKIGSGDGGPADTWPS